MSHFFKNSLILIAVLSFVQMGDIYARGGRGGGEREGGFDRGGEEREMSSYRPESRENYRPESNYRGAEAYHGEAYRGGAYGERGAYDRGLENGALDASAVEGGGYGGYSNTPVYNNNPFPDSIAPLPVQYNNTTPASTPATTPAGPQYQPY
jgi:hypothetical protein